MKNGILHFTSKEIAEKIIKEGYIGTISTMNFPESIMGELVWMYIGGNDIV